jgi:hypothetical protein
MNGGLMGASGAIGSQVVGIPSRQNILLLVVNGLFVLAAFAALMYTLLISGTFDGFLSVLLLYFGTLISFAQKIWTDSIRVRIEIDGLEYRRFFMVQRIEFTDVTRLDCSQSTLLQGPEVGFELLFTLLEREVVSLDLRRFTNHAAMLELILQELHRRNPKTIAVALRTADRFGHEPEPLLPERGPREHWDTDAPPVFGQLEQLLEVLYSIGANDQEARLARSIDGFYDGVVSALDLRLELQRLTGLTGPINTLRDQILEQLLEQLTAEPVAVS